MITYLAKTYIFRSYLCYSFQSQSHQEQSILKRNKEQTNKYIKKKLNYLFIIFFQNSAYFLAKSYIVHSDPRLLKRNACHFSDTTILQQFSFSIFKKNFQKN